MFKKTITFLSTRNRGITPNLKLLKDTIQLHSSEYCFYEILTATQEGKSKDVIDLIRQSISPFSTIICADGSLNTQISRAKSAKTILLLEPYDYLFKPHENSSHKKETFSQFSHILTGTKYHAQVLKQTYQLDHVTLLESIGLPLIDDFALKDKQAFYRSKIERLYPSAQNKKLFFLLTTGSPESARSHTLSDASLRDFLDDIPEDWFLITNNALLRSQLQSLEFSYSSRFAYYKNALSYLDLFYTADYIVTDSAYYGCLCASRNKPFDFIRYNDNAFIKHVDKRFPSLIVSLHSAVRGLSDLHMTDAHIRFSDYYGYPQTGNASTQILTLLK